MKKILLVIGDLTKDGVLPAPNINAFLWAADKIVTPQRPMRMVTYADVLARELPRINKGLITVALFFPFKYWNEHIEVYNKDARIYGDEFFGRDFKKLFLKVEKILNETYGARRLKYINSPSSCALDRDKKLTQKLLFSKGISVPKMFNIKSFSQVHKLLNAGASFYIKPRFGAMGKGITFLSKDVCRSNYIFRKGKIVSRLYDYNWNFKPIPKTKRDLFLKKLMKKGMLWEEAIHTQPIKRRRFDLRIYVIYGKVPYLYAKSAPKRKIVTNWSQGGRIEKKRFLKNIPKSRLNEAVDAAKKAAKVLKLNSCGIDIVFSRDFKIPYILDVQSFPAYERGFKLTRFLVEHI